MKSNIYLIEVLRIDPLENNSSRALYYEHVGFVVSEAEASKIVASGGFVIGDGWPIEKAVKINRYRYTAVNEITEKEDADKK